MNNDPYIGIIHTLKEKKSVSSCIGKVTCASPLRVSFSGIDFYEDDIYINPDVTLADGDSVCVLAAGDDIAVVCKVVKANE